MRRLEPDCASRPFVPPDLNSLISLLRPMGPHCVISWMKTICNGWVTTKRVRHSTAIFQNFSSRPRCLFGCSHDEDDDLAHYLHCIPLWSCVQDLIPEFSLSPFSEVVVGYSSSVTKHQILGVLLGFHIYHSLKDEPNCSAERLKDVSSSCYKVFILPMLVKPGARFVQGG